MSWSLLACKTWSSSPSLRAASCASLVFGSAFGLVGFTSAPMTAALGTASCSICSLIATVVVERKLTPVILPPGRLRLATRPMLTGSAPILKTIGIVVVAALAATAAGLSPA